MCVRDIPFVLQSLGGKRGRNDRLSSKKNRIHASNPADYSLGNIFFNAAYARDTI